MKQLGHSRMGQIQGMEEKCVQYVKKSQLYSDNENVRKLIDMDEDWIGECDVELLKKNLVSQINFKSVFMSLKNNEKGMRDLKQKMEDPVNLDQIKKNYL